MQLFGMRLANLSILFLCAFVFFVGLDAYPLLNNNEGLYASIGRDVYLHHHWAIPHLNGGPYLEKPPLLYWLLALSFYVFDVTTWAAHLVPALSGFCLMIATLWFSKRASIEKPGQIAVLLMLSSPVFVIMMRTIYFDGWLTCLVSLSLYAFYNRSYFLFYGALALAGLMKGFIAFILVFPVVVVYSLWVKEDWRSLFQPLPLLVFLGIFVPWHVAASLAHDQFLWFYVVNEHVLRFLDLREPRDYYRGPWYYYGHRVVLYLFPHSLWLPWVLRWQSLKKDETKKLPLFLLLWVGWFLIFFTLSRAKANYYLITIVPPLSLLGAMGWQQYGGKKWVMGLLGSLAILEIGIFLGIFLATPFLPIPPLWKPAIGPFQHFYFYAFCLGLITLLGWGIFKRKGTVVLGVLCLFNIGLVLPLTKGAGLVQDQFSLKRFVDGRDATQPLYTYQDFEDFSSLAFYWKQPITVVDSKSADLWFASKDPAQAHRYIPVSQLLERLKDGLPIQLALKEKKLPALQKALGSSIRLQRLKQVGQALLVKIS